MTKREPAISRSQNPSSHQSIEAAPAMMRRMGGVARSPKVSTHMSTPFDRTILSPYPASRTSESGVVGRSSSLFPVMMSPPLYPCSLKAPAGLAKLPALAESEALLRGDLEDQGSASSAFVVEGSVAHGDVRASVGTRRREPVLGLLLETLACLYPRFQSRLGGTHRSRILGTEQQLGDRLLFGRRFSLGHFPFS